MVAPASPPSEWADIRNEHQGRGSLGTRRTDALDRASPLSASRNCHE